MQLFRAEIGWWTNIAFPHTISIYCATEITNFCYALNKKWCYFRNQNILELQVSMNYIIIMQILKSSTYISYKFCNFLLRHTSLLFGQWVQSSPSCILHNQVDKFWIKKNFIQWNYITIFNKRMNFYLSEYNLLKIFWQYCLLRQQFYCEYHP